MFFTLPNFDRDLRVDSIPEIWTFLGKNKHMLLFSNSGVDEIKKSKMFIPFF